MKEDDFLDKKSVENNLQNKKMYYYFLRISSAYEEIMVYAYQRGLTIFKRTWEMLWHKADP